MGVRTCSGGFQSCEYKHSHQMELFDTHFVYVVDELLVITNITTCNMSGKMAQNVGMV